MNTIKKHINILLLGCCSLNFISCTDLTEEIFSDITEDSYKYEAGDATKVVDIWSASEPVFRKYTVVAPLIPIFKIGDIAVPDKLQC